jgi:hypothetical protein
MPTLGGFNGAKGSFFAVKVLWMTSDMAYSRQDGEGAKRFHAARNGDQPTRSFRQGQAVRAEDIPRIF